MQNDFAPRRQTKTCRHSACFRFFEKQEMPVAKLMGEVPPNRRRVADYESADACGKTIHRKFASQEKKDPQGHDRNQEQFHSPKSDAA